VRNVRFIGAIAVTVSLAACSSKSGPHMSDGERDDLAVGRAEWCSLQFVLDTDMIPAREMIPNAVENGVIAESATARLLYQRETTLFLSPHHSSTGPTVGSETDRLTQFVQLVPGLENSKGHPKGQPKLTPDQAADVVLVQELADAGYLDGRVFGATQTGGQIQPSPAVYDWVTAHSGDPLKPGVTATMAIEKQRIFGFISAPLPTPDGH